MLINNIAEHAEDDADLMHYLQRNLLTPGARLHVDEVAVANGDDYGDPHRIRSKGRRRPDDGRADPRPRRLGDLP